MPASRRNAGRIAAFLFDCRDDERALCQQSKINCGKTVYQEDLTDDIEGRERGTSHYEPRPHRSLAGVSLVCLIDLSVDVENDGHGYDHNI